MDNRGMGWQKAATDAPNGTLRTRLAAMPYQSELWAKRYPTLPGILEDEPNIPKRNVFRGNISAGGVWDDIHQGTRQYQTVEKNLAFDADKGWARLVEDKAGRPLRLVLKDPAAVQEIGFEALPLEKMGLTQDERRASWPVRHEVRPISLPEPEKPKPKPEAKLPPNPTMAVARTSAALTVDGALDPAEWAGLDAGKAISLGVNYDGTVAEPPARAWLAHDGEALRIGVSSPLPKKRDLGNQWGQCDAVEVAFRAADGANTDTLVLRGYTTGKWETCADAGAGQDALAQLAKGVSYAAKVAGDTWSAEWRISLKGLGVVPGDRLRSNITVRRPGDSTWVMWRPTHGNSYLVEKVGNLELAR